MIILTNWINSLTENLSPKNFILFLVKGSYVYFQATITLLRYFGWAIVADLIISYLFSQNIIQTIKAVKLQSSSLLPANVFTYLISSILWFMITISFLLSIRNHHKKIPPKYFFEGFLYYALLSMFLSFTFLLSFMLIINIGITQLPSIPWHILAIKKVIYLFWIFYWLDLRFSWRLITTHFYQPNTISQHFQTLSNYIKDIFVSLERALNIFLYNMPFVLLLLFIKIILQTGINYIIFGNIKTAFMIAQNLLISLQIPLEFLIPIESITTSLLVATKYINLLFNYFFVTLFFIFYSKTKTQHYSKYVFK